VDSELEAVLVLVNQTFDFDEVVLLETVDCILDVVPHLGFDLATAIAHGERQIWVAGFLRFDLLRDHHEAGSDDFIFVLDAIANEEFLWHVFLNRVNATALCEPQVQGGIARSCSA
jgi:hypothetical protein